MKEYKIKYLNKLPAFKTVGNELKGLPGLGELKNKLLCHAWVQIFVPKSVLKGPVSHVGSKRNTVEKSCICETNPTGDTERFP